MTQPQAYAEQKSLSDMYAKLSAAEKERDDLKAKLAVAVKALEELYIPYNTFHGGGMPRLPDVIIREALKAIGGE